MSKTEKQKIGAWGEEIATRMLREKGYKIIDRNFEIREGEIDIIAWHEKPHFGKTLCFIEVKTRGGQPGSAERATGKQKVGNMKQAAIAYCLRQHIDRESTPIQFEQVSIYGSPKGLKDVRHYEIPV